MKQALKRTKSEASENTFPIYKRYTFFRVIWAIMYLPACICLLPVLLGSPFIQPMSFAQRFIVYPLLVLVFGAYGVLCFFKDRLKLRITQEGLTVTRFGRDLRHYPWESVAAVYIYKHSSGHGSILEYPESIGFSKTRFQPELEAENAKYTAVSAVALRKDPYLLCGLLYSQQAEACVRRCAPEDMYIKILCRKTP